MQWQEQPQGVKRLRQAEEVLVSHTHFFRPLSGQDVVVLKFHVRPHGQHDEYART